MVTQTYIKLRALPDFSAFQFISKSLVGITTRQVRFIGQKDPGTFNLDLGDLQDGHHHSSFITDLGDMDHVLATMIQVIELYTERYPHRTIRLKGNTKEKMRLYRTALERYIDLLWPFFDIGLEKEKHFLPFRQNIDSFAFLLRRKPGLCFTVHTIQTTLSSHSLLFGRPISVELHKDIKVGMISIGRQN